MIEQMQWLASITGPLAGLQTQDLDLDWSHPPTRRHVGLITLFIPHSVLHVHSFSQGELSTEHDQVFPVSIPSALSFP